MEKSIVIYAAGRSGHVWVVNLFRSWMPRNYVIRDVESIHPWEYHEKMTTTHGHFYNPSWPVVIVVRDYLNWVASWIKYRHNSNSAAVPEDVMQRADIWHSITLEALQETDYIKNKYIVNYDLMTIDLKYREEICNHFGGNYNESKIDYIPVAGEGSSFDLRKYDGKGSQMDVRDRWTWFLSEEGEPYQCYLGLRPEILECYIENWVLPENKKRFCKSLLAAI